MSIPAGADQHGLTCHVEPVKRLCRDSPAVLRSNTNYNACEIRQWFEREFCEIGAVGESVEGGVEVGSGICHHLDLANLKLNTRSVVAARCFPAHVIADERARQTGVGDHSVLDGVAQ